MRKSEIVIPLRGALEGDNWRITAPFLKLALKYGMLGEWLHSPWSYFNRSVAFDAYSVTRGPRAGLPNLGDLCSTLMMNSGIKGDDLPRFLHWIGLPETVRELERLRKDLSSCEGLHDMPEKTVRQLADFADGAIQDTERLTGFKLARIFKWLSAWAPAHVPMFDSQVYHAMIGYYRVYRPHECLLLLQRYRTIVASHLQPLRELGERVGATWPQCFPCPIPPVRILDNLIWFDWWAVYEYGEDFWDYIMPNDNSGAHDVTEAGKRFLRHHGF